MSLKNIFLGLLLFSAATASAQIKTIKVGVSKISADSLVPGATNTPFKKTDSTKLAGLTSGTAASKISGDSITRGTTGTMFKIADSTTFAGKASTAQASQIVHDSLTANTFVLRNSKSTGDSTFIATGANGFIAKKTLYETGIQVVHIAGDSLNSIRVINKADSAGTATALLGKQSTLTNSAGLAAAINDETGTGLAVFNTDPVFSGTPKISTDTVATKAYARSVGGGGGGGSLIVVGSATASGTNTYTASISGLSAYTTGQSIFILFTTGNSGSSTININSIGAKTIKKNVSADMVSGDIISGEILQLVFDGTNYQIVGSVLKGVSNSQIVINDVRIGNSTDIIDTDSGNPVRIGLFSGVQLGYAGALNVDTYSNGNRTSINNAGSRAGVQFEVYSTTAVSCPFPRMTESQRTAMTMGSGQVGGHVYQTDAGSGGEGVYVYKSTGWVKAY